MSGSAGERQVAAADPGRSTWLTANAGSGKTRVLTDRVARLLLSGVRPQNVLCLTFTKAAAGEMQNRLFQRLGEWAMKPDDELATALGEIGVPPSGSEGLARARRLFAAAIETPGGLKIQTIHSFCASILRQFPLEARVSPRFREIDERESRMMLQDLFDRFAEGPDRALLAAIAAHIRSGGLPEFLDKVVSHAGAFAEGVRPETVRDWFGVPEGETAEAVAADYLAAWDEPFLARLDLALPKHAQFAEFRRRDHAARHGARRGRARLEDLAGALLTQEHGVPKRLVTNAVRAALGPEADRLESQVEDLRTALLRLSALDEAERTTALWQFGRRFCAAYAAEKTSAGVLDFDDLIQRTLALLSDPGVAEWVLYRLDGGIDHILVDEAQDTSPAQWAIIEKLAQEFSSGVGARDGVRRTIFAVGDPKQSIYSFQGADPGEFARMQGHFHERLAASEAPLQVASLLHSFRSSPVILRLVDTIFGTGDSGVGGGVEHLAFHPDRPGRIEWWPIIGKPDKDELPAWHDSSDRISPEKETLDLARQIVQRLKGMLASATIPVPGGGMRRLTPGDVVILVRRRSFVTDILIAELKRERIAVAGADQIALASDLAAMDVVALLRFLDAPGDSLSLAAALRSPLFGLSEQELYDLAQGRDARTSLWDSLQARRARFPEAVEILEDLLAHADFLRPYELIARLLIRHQGRSRLVARLGVEVEEALDILMDQAVAFEAAAVPSLTGFLAWHEVDGLKVKRQLETGSDAVRVMTVHGAKGLESEVVILPDTAEKKPPPPETIFVLPGGKPIFRPSKPLRPPALDAAFLDTEAAAAAEEDRLFYVALTRAKHWLIVCGAGASQPGKPSWHQQVRGAMERLGAVPDGEEGLRLDFGDWQAPAAETVAARPAAVAVPDWAVSPAGPPPERERLISPSLLGQGMTVAAGAELAAEEAALRGRLLHLLLEHLPQHDPSDWPEVSVLLLSQQDEPVDDATIADLLAEARTVLTAPEIAPLFALDALNEVDVTAALPEAGGRRMLGRIDRLVWTAEGLLAIDYKSHAVPPTRIEDIPPGILAQLGCYASALAAIFPGQRIEVAVLWTRTAQLMRLPNDIVTAALAEATTS